jgi:hypothetical protein
MILTYLALFYFYLCLSIEYLSDKNSPFSLLSLPKAKCKEESLASDLRNSSNVSPYSNQDYTNLLPCNITPFLFPGLYLIKNLENEKVYVGETSNLLDRITKHWMHLNSGVHHCSELQKDFSACQDKSQFHFLVIECGPQWFDSNKRQAKETEVISSYDKEKLYNTLSDTEQRPIINKPFMYKSQRFESDRQAAKVLSRSRSQIKRDLLDPSKPDIYYLESEASFYGEIPIFAKKGDGPSVLFTSMKACIAAGYATNTQNARRKIQRQEEGWRYASLDEKGKPVRKPYTLKSGEISYEMLINNNLSE